MTHYPTRSPNSRDGDPIAAAQATEHEKMRVGSQMLKEACERLFWRFAWKHGLTEEKACELQLRGYRA